MTDNTVATTTPLLTNNTDLLRDIRSFDDAMKVIQDAGINIVDYTEEFGDGFTLLKGNDDKAMLVRVPFVILGAKLAKGDYGDDSVFAVLHVVTQDGRKFVIVDGGTGICDQTVKMIDRGITGGVLVRAGLSRSDYEYINDKGEKSPATTFYLSN